MDSLIQFIILLITFRLIYGLERSVGDLHLEVLECENFTNVYPLPELNSCVLKEDTLRYSEVTCLSQEKDELYDAPITIKVCSFFSREVEIASTFRPRLAEDRIHPGHPVLEKCESMEPGMYISDVKVEASWFSEDHQTIPGVYISYYPTRILAGRVALPTGESVDYWAKHKVSNHNVFTWNVMDRGAEWTRVSQGPVEVRYKSEGVEIIDHARGNAWLTKRYPAPEIDVGNGVVLKPCDHIETTPSPKDIHDLDASLRYHAKEINEIADLSKVLSANSDCLFRDIIINGHQKGKIYSPREIKALFGKDNSHGIGLKQGILVSECRPRLVVSLKIEEGYAQVDVGGGYVGYNELTRSVGKSTRVRGDVINLLGCDYNITSNRCKDTVLIDESVIYNFTTNHEKVKYPNPGDITDLDAPAVVTHIETMSQYFSKRWDVVANAFTSLWSWVKDLFYNFLEILVLAGLLTLFLIYKSTSTPAYSLPRPEPKQYKRVVS